MSFASLNVGLHGRVSVERGFYTRSLSKEGEGSKQGR